MYGILNPDFTTNFKKITELSKSDPDKSFLDIRFTVGCIISSPVIKDKVIYFGSTDKNFYAIH
ncbi:MAG: hypothetical protein ABI462_07265 [Ignavibacteria bacterium]